MVLSQWGLDLRFKLKFVIFCETEKNSGPELSPKVKLMLFSELDPYYVMGLSVLKHDSP